MWESSSDQETIILSGPSSHRAFMFQSPTQICPTKLKKQVLVPSCSRKVIFMVVCGEPLYILVVMRRSNICWILSFNILWAPGRRLTAKISLLRCRLVPTMMCTILITLCFMNIFIFTKTVRNQAIGWEISGKECFRRSMSWKTRVTGKKYFPVFCFG